MGRSMILRQRQFGVTAISRGSVTDATKRVGRKYKAQLEEDKPKQP